LPGAAAGKRQQCRRVLVASADVRQGLQSIRRRPADRERQRKANHDFDGYAAQRRHDQAKQVGLGSRDQRLRWVHDATTLDVCAAGRRIEEHRHQPQPKQRQQRDVQLGRHRMKDQHGVARL
jgi:hypothetical protein